MFQFWTWAEVALHAVHVVFCLGEQSSSKAVTWAGVGISAHSSLEGLFHSILLKSILKQSPTWASQPVFWASWAPVQSHGRSPAGGVRASVWTQICFGENVAKRECPCWDRAKAVAEQGWTSPRWILLLEAGPLSLHVISVALCLCCLPPEPGHVAALHSSGSANQKRNVVWEFLIVAAN